MTNTKIEICMKDISDVENGCIKCTRPIERWLEVRKTAGLSIDPETAEVTWSYEEMTDIYGVYRDAQVGHSCVGRAYFARSPGSAIWVWFGDLPRETQERLWKVGETQQKIKPHPFDF